ncbi:MAG: DUF1015 domain-containing protein [Oscillospiraceae bacterium]|jgi:uncharacterized protein (DUF1015 family)|nr:DUF1015 domain-containing protein [Oscillospiraceae bacterium]
MAEVIAFKGMRFNTQQAGELKTLCCPPYDIISEEQRQEFIKSNQNNIIRLELPKEGENPYSVAAEVLKKWEQSGILKFEDKPALYVYEEEFTAYGQRKAVKGIIARVKVEEFEKGIILPHEFTLSKAKEDRLNLMKATNCNFSQIYALYTSGGKNTAASIDAVSAGEPDLQFSDDDNITHRMWIVTDEEAIAQICGDFDDRKLYIADGHHRYETALNYRNWCRQNGIAKPGDAQDYQMIYLVDMEHPGLVVFPTHRLVFGLEGFDIAAALDEIKQLFDVTRYDTSGAMEEILDTYYKKGDKAFGMYCGGGAWYLLVLRDFAALNTILPEASEPTKNLDVTVLHTLILERVFKIDKENMAAQRNLTYTKFFAEAIEGVDSGKFQCAFVMNPTRVSEIREVAENGEKMPQKSTYFYPKMITGMVMNKLV